MTTPSRTCHFQECKAEVPEGFREKGLCLDHYLYEAGQKVAAAMDAFLKDKGVDRQSLGWLLEQVDFIVDIIGDERLSLDDDERSRLLELLLSVANLNEYIRHQGETDRGSLAMGYPGGTSVSPSA